MVISIVPVAKITVADLKTLKSLSTLGFSAIKPAAAEQSSIRDFELFGSNWQDVQPILAQLSQAYSRGAEIPYTVWESIDGEREKLSPEMFANRLNRCREIERAQQQEDEARLKTDESAK